jgi:hypothetical protein
MNTSPAERRAPIVSFCPADVAAAGASDAPPAVR